MLRDKATLGYIGLSEREIMVIQSIFRMTERFHHIFELPRENEQRIPDVVFVDAESPAALGLWRDFLLKKNASAIPIYVANSTRATAGEHHLSRPLILRKLMEVLESVHQRFSGGAEFTTDHTSSAPALGLRVLVVDDSLPVRTYMSQKVNELCNGRVTIDFAEDGESATAQISKRDYDMVFLDVMMPGMDGYKTCKWIKANNPTYVVLLTSRSSPFDKVRGTMSGCDTYLVKPPQDDDLRRLIAARIASMEKQGVNSNALQQVAQF